MKTLRNVVIAVLLASLPAMASTPNTITVDGDLSDWAADETLAPDSRSDSDWEFNEFYSIHATWDADNFYIGVAGEIEQANSYSLYFDTGAGSDATDLSSVAWEKQLEAQGWVADFSVQASGLPDTGAYRIFGDFDADEVTTTSGVEIVLDVNTGSLEAQIPWDVLYPNGMPNNARILIVGAITGLFEWDAGDAIPDQTTGPDGDGVVDVLDQFIRLDIDNDGDGRPDDGWFPNTNSDGSNQPPTVSVSADVTTGPAPLTVDFFGAITDLDGDIVTDYEWDFDDGTTNTTDFAILHTFTTPGTYQVSLTATDPSGAVGVDNVQITVTPPAGSAIINVTTANPPVFRPNQNLIADVTLQNGPQSLPVNLYIVMEIDGAFLWWPTWGSVPSPVSFDMPPDFDLRYRFLDVPLGATVPDVGPYNIYGALLDNGGNIVGDLSQAEFSLASQ